MQRVLVTGATGLIGRELVKQLLAEGFAVNTLGRKYAPLPGVRSFVWDLDKNQVDPNALQGVQHIIHLAGAGVADSRWTEARKREIIESRVKPIDLLIEGCLTTGTSVRTFISASGINYYGTSTSSTIFSEITPAGHGFLSDVCVQWEEAAARFVDLGARVAMLRTGVVLAANGGALEKMARPVKIGLGSALATGNQWVPWVHVTDAARAYVHALTTSKMTGPVNLCAPQHITNKELTRAIALATKRMLLLPNVPAVALQAIWGEMACLLTEGSRASSAKLEGLGFTFHYPTIKTALQQIYG